MAEPTAGQQGSISGIAAVTDRKQSKPHAAIRFLRWVWSFALPGIGMFQEAYFIFSVGNLKPIWQAQYPACWVVSCFLSLISHMAVSLLLSSA